MNVTTASPSSGIIQLSFLDAIIDLLLVAPVFWLGIIFIGILLIVIFKKDTTEGPGPDGVPTYSATRLPISTPTPGHSR